MSRLEKYYEDLMKTPLIVKCKNNGFNWTAKVILPTTTVTAIASSEEEARELALVKAEAKLVSGDTIYGNPKTGEKGSKDTVGPLTINTSMLQKVYLDKMAQYHIESRLHKANMILASALQMDSRKGKKHISENKKAVIHEGKQAKKYLKETENSISEKLKKPIECLGKEDVFDLSPELFNDFCEVFRRACKRKSTHLKAAMLVLDKDGKIEYDGQKFNLEV